MKKPDRVACPLRNSCRWSHFCEDAKPHTDTERGRMVLFWDCPACVPVKAIGLERKADA